MISFVAIAFLGVLATQWPSPAAADPSAYTRLSTGFHSGLKGNEVGDDMARPSGEDGIPLQVAQDHPAVQECGRRGEVSDQRWVACVDEYFRRIESERKRRIQDFYEAERQREQRQREEAERRRQMELEERRVRALEEAAQAQREQAETARRPRTCKTVGYERGRPIVECYYPDIPATR